MDKEKTLELFYKQKELLDNFLVRDAISKEQYETSLTGLITKMNIAKEDLDIIITSRLILRKWRIEDAPSMFKYACEPEVGLPCGWKPHENVQESERIIKAFIDHHPYCYAICLRGDIEHPIGSIELNLHTSLCRSEDECELGYWIGKPYWGNGFLPEAGKALVKYGFEVLKYNAIWCGYYEGNNKSKRAQEKIGFVYQRTEENTDVPQLNEVRTANVSLLTKERWVSLNS